MTQDEKWLSRYKEVKSFIEVNHRNPSKYVPEERLMVHSHTDLMIPMMPLSYVV